MISSLILDNQYTVHFKSNISGFNSEAEKVVIQNAETEKYENVVNVFIEDSVSNKMIYNFEIRCEIPGTFFRGYLFFNDFIVLAVEDYLYLYNKRHKTSIMYKLSGYFDAFHNYSNYFIVCTDSHLTKINELGEVEWISDKLANEKIKILKLSESNIFGNGFWSNPKEIKPFNILLNNGKLAKKIVEKNNTGLKGFFKKLTEATF